MRKLVLAVAGAALLLCAGTPPAWAGYGISLEEGRKHWSFQPVADVAPPSVKDEAAVRTEIDRFVLAKLGEKGLGFSKPAEKLALLRRACFDLTGLPPTPEQQEAFLADQSPEAYEKVIDALLRTTAYGERWGRHWLDVARYADTAGESADYPIPQAYLYRNYVIAAFNDDKPYDQFLKEQIAGDLMPHASDDERRSHVVATGFVAMARRFSVDPDSAMHQTLEDCIDTTGRATMGLTLSCARCHDHKFDPVTMRDYYALYGIFSSTRFPFPGSENKKRQRDMVPLIAESQVAEIEAPFVPKLAEADEAINRLREEAEAARAGRIQSTRTPGDWVELFRQARSKRDAISDQMPDYPKAYALAEGTPADARVQKRGEPGLPGETVPRGFLEVLGGQKVPAGEKASGRLELANWIASPDNPLTARVMVNRLWHYHFGKGLVQTPNDFGHQGRRPTHPELLDWLARRFVQDGWSVKKMHRLIMLSAVYRQSSDLGSEALVPVSTATAKAAVTGAALDPQNDLLWAFPRRRLDAETTRDAMLFVSGQIDLAPGGAHPFPPQKSWGWTQHNPFTAVYETNKRSVYLMQQRIRKHPFLATFDGADANASTPERFVTTTPLQALFLMNDSFAHAQADAFAERLLGEERSEYRRIDRAHWLALGRPATVAEIASAIPYLASVRARTPDPGKAEAAAWASYARILFASNEFVYVD